MKKIITLLAIIICFNANAQMKKLFMYESSKSIGKLIDSIQLCVGSDFVQKKMDKAGYDGNGRNYRLVFGKSNDYYFILSYKIAVVDKTNPVDSVIMDVSISGNKDEMVAIWKKFFNKKIDMSKPYKASYTGGELVDKTKYVLSKKENEIANKFYVSSGYFIPVFETIEPKFTIKFQYY